MRLAVLQLVAAKPLVPENRRLQLMLVELLDGELRLDGIRQAARCAYWNPRLPVPCSRDTCIT